MKRQERYLEKELDERKDGKENKAEAKKIYSSPRQPLNRSNTFKLQHKYSCAARLSAAVLTSHKHSDRQTPSIEYAAHKAKPIYDSRHAQDFSKGF